MSTSFGEELIELLDRAEVGLYVAARCHAPAAWSPHAIPAFPRTPHPAPRTPHPGPRTPVPAADQSNVSAGSGAEA
jgi:hypothetical protein